MELNRRSRNTKHTNANLSNSNPPRVIQSLRGRLRLVVSLDLLPGRSTQVSLWSLSGMRESRSFCLLAAKPKHRWCACQRAPATPAGTGISGASSILLVSECPPHTETSDTSERNLETKFSKRVAGYHRSFRVVDSFSFSTAGVTILRASSAYRDISVGTMRISRQNGKIPQHMLGDTGTADDERSKG